MSVHEYDMARALRAVLAMTPERRELVARTIEWNAASIRHLSAELQAVADLLRSMEDA